MILDLDQDESLDPTRVGSKASRLAAARRAGLPVPSGFVIPAEMSIGHLELGARELEARGSGGARLAVIHEPITFGSELIVAGSELGPNLVARSSTILEGSGEWSGAFTSYLDLTPPDLPKAVVGSWASAFSVAALERQTAAGIRPGSFSMPVLVQSSLRPQSGGVAELEPDGTIVVVGVAGHPGPLLQGWVGGHRAHRSNRENASWVGLGLIEIVTTESLDSLASALETAHDLLGVNRCEWAIDGDLWILQLDETPPRVQTSRAKSTSVADPAFVTVARAAAQAIGDLAEELIMPWGLAGLPTTIPSAPEGPDPRLAEAKRLAAELTSQVWAMPPEEAASAASQCISDLLGPDPSQTLEILHGLRPPDMTTAANLVSLVKSIQRRNTTRLGVGRWEPFIASVVLASGVTYEGTPASSGIGAGIGSNMTRQPGAARFAPRTVITAKEPVPALASLLWDAAGLVTETGSPVAHLFETARSLAIPAVCGVRMPFDSDQVVAVDGYNGLVSTIELVDGP